MSRANNKKNPFYATNLAGMKAGPRNIVRETVKMLTRSGDDCIWPGSGKRGGSVEHNSGTAMDWIVSATTGRRPTAAEIEASNRFVDWLIQNRVALNIEGILWSRDGKVTWAIGYSKGWGGWRRLADRGSISANHVDHIHVKYRATSKWPASLNFSTLSGTTRPTLPDTGDKWDGKSYPGSGAFRTGKKHRAVKIVQEQLKRHGFNPGEVDSFWGRNTASATRQFQLAQGWTGSDADGIPGSVTWARLNGKTLDELAAEVRRGAHGNGHTNRQKSLGVDSQVYKKIHERVLKLL